MEDQYDALAPIPNRSVVERVMDRITEAILSGQYKPGDQIPTEEGLAAAFGIGRNSVREAVKVLVALGVLEIRRAEGTFVASSYSERMFNPALYGAIVQESGLEDIIEMRRIFDEGVAQLAILKGTEEDMQEIVRCCDQLTACLKRDGRDIEGFLRCDLAFHKSIEDAVHNALLPNMSSVITKLTIPSRRETVRRGLSAGRVDYFVECHRMLADVIVNRQSEKVPETIRYHYDMWRETPQ